MTAPSPSRCHTTSCTASVTGRTDQPVARLASCRRQLGDVGDDEDGTADVLTEEPG